MNKKSVLITGAAGGLGSAMAKRLATEPERYDLILTDFNEEKLKEVADETRARLRIVADLFDVATNQEIVCSHADVWLLTAARNVDEDTSIKPENRMTVAAEQNRTVLQQIISLLKQGRKDIRSRLIVPVLSVTAKHVEYADEKTLDSLQKMAEAMNWHYGDMKSWQSGHWRKYRKQLETWKMSIAALYPGAINTAMTNPQNALKNNNKIAGKIKPKDGQRSLHQERIFEPAEIADSTVNLVQYWEQYEAIPENTKEWIMLNPADLAVTPTQEKP